MKTARTPETIDDYVAGFPPDIREILQKIRVTIRKAAPGAEEAIRYQMPTFFLKGTSSVHFAAWKKHIGFYGTWTGGATLKDELSVYAGPKGSLKFPLDKPIPFDLIGRIVTLKVRERLAAARKIADSVAPASKRPRGHLRKGLTP